MVRPVLAFLGAFTLLTGLAYPALLTGAAQLVFPAQANGSVLASNGRPAGSSLVGQPFSEARYFWGRPSATAPVPYDGRASAGSNLGPTNPALTSAVRDRIAALRASGPVDSAPVPVDLVTASGSGLDPHLSPAGALFQVERVAAARRLPAREVRALVEGRVERPFLRIFGAPRVNVLSLNLALDELSAGRVDAERSAKARALP